MHEIITIHVGQCGTCIGLNYWESLADEHGLNCSGAFVGTSPLQLEKIGVNFDESSAGRYVPRAVFADMDSTAISAMSDNQCAGLFHPDSLIEGSGEAASNFGRGFDSRGARTIAEAVLAMVRRQLELSDRVRAIHIVHSLGGGTGSGLTSRLLADGLSGVPVHTFSLFPSQSAVVEAYNTVLTTPHLSSSAELTYCWDLNGLRVASGRQKPDIEDVNRTAASMIVGLTACIRFPGQQNLSPAKLANALIPLPRLHFILPALAFGSRHGGSARELVSRMLSPEVQLATCEPSPPERILSAAGIFRGRVPMQALDGALTDFRQRRGAAFPSWLTHAFSMGVCDIPPRGESLSAVFFANTSSAARLIERQAQQVRKLFESGKAFFHLYQQEGITDADMTEALDECDELCKLYADTVKA